jgi:chemotaxis protein MotB
MSNDNTRRVVVRRIRKRASERHHGGSWKIAYADFVTAMMAFFLVMWLLAIVPNQDLQGIASYFRMPLRVALEGGPKPSVDTSAIPGGGTDPLRDQGQVRRADGERLQAQAQADRRDQRRLEDLKARLEALIQSNPILKSFRPQLLLDITTEGLRIQIVDNQNRPMFATASADVKSYMRDILRELGPVLNDLPNKVSVSGHTDAVQYARGEKAYSNWELSADRANASRQELVAGGMHEGKVLRVIGLASGMSLVKDDPYAAVNRRISLVVLNMRTQRRIESENAAAADITAASADEAAAAVAAETAQTQERGPTPATSATSATSATATAAPSAATVEPPPASTDSATGERQ